jgi:D-glycero-D-manno-heptose 1,7-bisphosphate phosphatase
VSVLLKPAAPVTQCVILAGEAGGYQRPVGAEAGKPFSNAAGLLDSLIDEVARFGISDFIVVHPPSTPDADHAVRPGRDGRMLTITTFQPDPGDLAEAFSRFSSRLCDTFLLISGNTFFDCNIAGLVQPALESGRMMRVAVCRGLGPASCAPVELEGDRVVGVGKQRQVSGSGWISAGICYMRKEALSLLDRVPLCSLASDVLPRLLQAGAIEARRFDGKVIDLGATADTSINDLFPIRRAAVFFDRDGVLNEDSGYVHQPHALRWLPGARESIRAVNDSGRFAFVVTNQSGVARGYYDEDAVASFHAEMQRQLLAVGAHVDAFVFCPHHPDGILPAYARRCDCRKPLPGMILKVLEGWPVQRQGSILIGDKLSDLLAAEAAGLAGRLYGGGDVRQSL